MLTLESAPPQHPPHTWPSAYLASPHPRFPPTLASSCLRLSIPRSAFTPPPATLRTPLRPAACHARPNGGRSSSPCAAGRRLPSQPGTRAGGAAGGGGGRHGARRRRRRGCRAWGSRGPGWLQAGAAANHLFVSNAQPAGAGYEGAAEQRLQVSLCALGVWAATCCGC